MYWRVCCMIKVLFPDVFFFSPQKFLLKVLCLLCFSYFVQEMCDIKYTGKCLAIRVFALVEMVNSEFRKQLAAVHTNMDIQMFPPASCFEDGPASCQHSLLANHNHITHSPTHTHTHAQSLCFCTPTSCHSNWEEMH